MTSPRDPNDSWAELYRELGVDDSAEPKPIPLVETNIPPESHSAESDASNEECIESEEVGSADAEDLEDDGEEELESVGGEGSAEGSEGDESDPGQKKRRRRRRRRKKKGGNGATPTSETVGEAIPVVDTESEGGFEEENSEMGFVDGEEEEVPAVALGVEEDVSSEMTRDIIANWNVPSWEQIITGLYRPER